MAVEVAGDQVQDHAHLALAAAETKHRLGLIVEAGDEVDEANLLVADRRLVDSLPVAELVRALGTFILDATTAAAGFDHRGGPLHRRRPAQAVRSAWRMS